MLDYELQAMYTRVHVTYAVNMDMDMVCANWTYPIVLDSCYLTCCVTYWVHAVLLYVYARRGARPNASRYRHGLNS